MLDTNAIKKACKQLGSQAAIARLLSLSPSQVNEWIRGDRRVPAEHCPDIEAATGIRCEELRPDVNWGVLRKTRKAPANA